MQLTTTNGMFGIELDAAQRSDDLTTLTLGRCPRLLHYAPLALECSPTVYLAWPHALTLHAFGSPQASPHCGAAKPLDLHARRHSASTAGLQAASLFSAADGPCFQAVGRMNGFAFGRVIS